MSDEFTQNDAKNVETQPAGQQNAYQTNETAQPQTGQLYQGQPMYQQAQPQQTYQAQPVYQQQNTYQTNTTTQPQGSYQQTYQSYGQPMYQNYGQPQGGNGMAIASMVLGIVSCVFCWAWFIVIPTSIVGLILGLVHKSKGARSGMATAGVACSIVGIVCFVLMILLVVLASYM